MALRRTCDSLFAPLKIVEDCGLRTLPIGGRFIRSISSEVEQCSYEALVVGSIPTLSIFFSNALENFQFREGQVAING
jgi:hypothetical protein